MPAAAARSGAARAAPDGRPVRGRARRGRRDGRAASGARARARRPARISARVSSPPRMRAASVSPARSSRCRGPSTRASPPGRARMTERRSARLRSAKRRIAPRRRASSSAIVARSSARTGAANSAAAVGVGARRSAAWSISVQSVSWPTAAMTGMTLRATARTATSSLKLHRSSSEPPPRATISTSGRGARPPAAQRIEAVDRRGDFGRRRLALHPHRPHDDVDRESVGEPVQNVADDRAGRRRHHADHPRQERNLALARGVEQPLRGELLSPRLEERHQRADAGELQLLDDDLVARLAGKGGELSGRDDFDALLGLDLHADEGGAPDRRRRGGRPRPSGRSRRDPKHAARDSRKPRRAPGHSRTGPRSRA